MKQPLVATSSLVAVVGIVLLYVTPPEEKYKNRRLASVIIISFSSANYNAIMATISTNTTGFTRRQLSTSMAFFLYCVVNIVTPQTFLGTESPRYHTGLGFVLGYVLILEMFSKADSASTRGDTDASSRRMLSVFIALAYSTALFMRLENNRRDKKALTNPEYSAGEQNMDEMSGLRYGHLLHILENLRALTLKSQQG